jgi:hypothetical protein
MRRYPVYIVILGLLYGCTGGASVELDPPDPDAGRVDSVGDLAAGDVLGPEDSRDAMDAQADQNPVDLLTPDLPPACAPGEGCFGDPCGENGDCLSGWCVDHLGGAVCTDTCQEDCPAGWTCKPAGTEPDLVYVCVSDFPSLCVPCAAAADCTSVTGQQTPCLPYPDGGAFCGGPCDEDEDCPQGFGCIAVETLGGATLMQCVAEAGTCECTEKSVALGLSTPCAVSNDQGTCPGFRVCTAAGLSDCDAVEPVAEACDGLDNDCDGETDEATCDDGNDCTEDLCLGVDGCDHVALDGVECHDGDLCTTGDQCVLGACLGAPMDCDDAAPCTDDGCDSETGACLNTVNQAPCDDGDPCTVADSCQEGACLGVAIDCDCLSDEDCGKLEDGDLCNGTLVCDIGSLPHLCVVDPETVVLCPGPGDGPDAPCLAAACDPATGTCGLVEANEGFPCDDGDPCTVGDLCEKGACVQGIPANCADGNPCTDDSCAPAQGCIHAPNTVPCEDGDVCTVGDQCEGGQCVHGPEVSCDDGNPCSDDSCDPATGCVHVPNQLDCDDGNACTGGDHCVAGACQGGQAVSCDDDNLCTDDTCALTLGCVHTPNQAPCDDGDLCTTLDLCDLGQCVGSGALPCNDGNPCTDDACDPLAGCQFVPNQAPCDDGNACTAGEQCSDGACLGGQAVSCDDGNLCTDDTCDTTGGCAHAPNQAPCNDGDLCTTLDQCHLGQCLGGGALPCDDGNPCTDDACDPLAGCQFTPNQAPCDDGNACTPTDLCDGGQCSGSGGLVCDDDNVCTADFCDPAVGCVQDPVDGSCDDGDLCTLGDLCAAGACVPGGLSLVCDDANPCTDDSCAPLSGCEFVPNQEPCDDDDICTLGDQCSAGLCVSGGDAPDCDDGLPCTLDLCLPQQGCTHEVVPAGSPCDDSDDCTFDDQCLGLLCVGSLAPDCGGVADCTSQPVPVGNSLSLGGTLHGTDLAADPVVYLAPGASLAGQVELVLEHTDPGSPLPLVMVPSWQDHATGFEVVDAAPAPGSQGYTWPVSMTAPLVDGVYYLVFAATWDANGPAVASATAAALGDPIWDNGLDVAGWPAATLEGAMTGGEACAFFLDEDGITARPYLARAVKIVVDSTPLDVRASFTNAQSIPGGFPYYIFDQQVSIGQAVDGALDAAYSDYEVPWCSSWGCCDSQSYYAYSISRQVVEPGKRYIIHLTGGDVGPAWLDGFIQVTPPWSIESAEGSIGSEAAGATYQLTDTELTFHGGLSYGGCVCPDCGRFDFDVTVVRSDGM